MAKQDLNIGTLANDGTGDTLRDGGTKVKANFYELYTALVVILYRLRSQDRESLMVKY